jgi:hypothetical protein
MLGTITIVLPDDPETADTDLLEACGVLEDCEFVVSSAVIVPDPS